MRVRLSPASSLLLLLVQASDSTAQLPIPDLAARMATAVSEPAAPGSATLSDLEITGHLDVPTGSFGLRILLRREPFAYREELTWHGAPGATGAPESDPPPGHARFTVFISDGARCWNLADEVGPAGPMAGLAAVELLDSANLFRLLIDPVGALEGVALEPRLVTESLDHHVGEDHDDLFLCWPHRTAWVATIERQSGRLLRLSDSTGATNRWYRLLEWRPQGEDLVLPSRIEAGLDDSPLSVVRLEAARTGLRHTNELFAGDPAVPPGQRLDAARLLVAAHPVPGAAAFILPDVAVHGARTAREVWTVFDTGASGVCIHPDLADGLGLLLIGMEATSGVFGTNRSELRWIDRLDLGRHALLQLPAPSQPFPPFNEVPAERTLGVIAGGLRVMQLSPVLDLRAGRLVLRDGTVHPLAKLAGRPAALVPMRDDGHSRPEVTVSIGGVPVTALLDTGLPQALRLARADLPRLGLPEDDDAWHALGAVPYHASAFGGQSGEDLLVRLEQDVSLGSLTLHQPWVLVARASQGGEPELPTLVGAGALSSLEQVGLDWANGRLELIAPDGLLSAPGGDSAAPRIVVPPPARFLGFILDPPDRGATEPPHSLPHVISVRPGTPAAAAGLREGDMLARAAGIDCEGLAPMDFWQRLHPVADGDVELRVRREGVEEEVVLRIGR